MAAVNDDPKSYKCTLKTFEFFVQQLVDASEDEIKQNPQLMTMKGTVEKIIGLYKTANKIQGQFNNVQF
jgi:hypothetical protein